MGTWHFEDETFCAICSRILRGQKERDAGLCAFHQWNREEEPVPEIREDRDEFATRINRTIARRIDKLHGEARDHQGDMFEAVQHDLQRIADLDPVETAKEMQR